MYFQHSQQIWRDYPQLAPGVIFARGISADVPVSHRLARFTAIASKRLAIATEAELPEIRAWRHTFSRMGLKPTQYRCAAESLLRRFRKQGELPGIHPLIDLCNAVSLAFAIPVAAFDTARITDGLEVRYASGDEAYAAFSAETERPTAGEVIFADAADGAHARRWTHRQSAASAVRDTTVDVLIVAEALHEQAATDIAALTATMAEELDATWSANPRTAVLNHSAPRFEF